MLASGSAEYESLNAKQLQPSGSARYSGWRFGSLISCIEVGVCLAINILFSVLATAIKGAPDGISTLYEGDCNKAHNMDTWLHIALNGLATILIGASNYNMQCLSAPSRSEVDKAHLDGKSVNIGVPSIRNFRYISGRRISLWMILCISTIPLHLFWNSAIFSTLQKNNYVVFGIPADAVQHPDSKCPVSSKGLLDSYESSPYEAPGYEDIVCTFYDFIRNPSTAPIQVQKLGLDECIQQYNKEIQSEWSNFAIVFNKSASLACSCNARPEPLPSNYSSTFNTTDGYGSPFSILRGGRKQEQFPCSINIPTDQTYWYTGASQMCGPDDQSAMSDLGFLNLYYRLDYCLVSKFPQVCKLQFSLWIMVVVILCNAIKLIAIMCARKLIKEDHFITLGDAVASFLEDFDSNTIGVGLKALTQPWGRCIPPRFPAITASHPSEKTTAARKKIIWLRAVPRGRLCSIITL